MIGHEQIELDSSDKLLTQILTKALAFGGYRLHSVVLNAPALSPPYVYWDVRRLLQRQGPHIEYKLHSGLFTDTLQIHGIPVVRRRAEATQQTRRDTHKCICWYSAIRHCLFNPDSISPEGNLYFLVLVLVFSSFVSRGKHLKKALVHISI